MNIEYAFKPEDGDYDRDKEWNKQVKKFHKRLHDEIEKEKEPILSCKPVNELEWCWNDGGWCFR